MIDQNTRDLPDPLELEESQGGSRELPTSADRAPTGKDEFGFMGLAVTADDIRKRTGKWQLILYIINGLTAVMGIVVIGIAGYSKSSPNSFALPAFTLNLLIAFGVIVVVCSLIGIYGSWRAPDKIDNRTTNWFLWFYFLIIAIALIIELVVAGLLLSLVGTINTAASTQYQTVANSFEDQIRTLIANNPAEWVQIQNWYSCCGYNCSNTWQNICPNDYPTGQYCVLPGPSSVYPINPTPPSVPTCRAELLSNAAQSATLIGAVVIIFAVMELLAFTATFCLLCCVKVDTELE